MPATTTTGCDLQRHGLPRRVVHAALCLGALLCLAPRPVDAQEATPLLLGDVADRHKTARVVALLPLRPRAVSPERLFGGQRSERGLLQEVSAIVAASMQAHDFHRYLRPAEARRRLAGNRAAEAARKVAQERYRLGVEYYMSMAFDRAAQSMSRAAAIYEELFQDIVDPKPLADAYLIRGVSLVQKGQLPAAHVAFKKMFAIQPDRAFSRRGFYGPAVDQALVRALRDEAVTGKHEAPFGSVERLHRVATALRADAVFFGSVVSSADGPVLLLGLYRADHRVIGGQLKLAIADVVEPGSDSRSRIDGFVARMMACLPVRARAQQPKARGGQGIWMDTSAVGGAFLRKPTRLQFYSLGFAAGVDQQLRPGFSFFGRVNVLTSLPDPYRDLLQSFNSLRGIVGVGFALQFGRLRLFLKPGVEAHVLGSAVATRDPGCKFFSLDHWTCNQTAAVTKQMEQDVLVGVNAAIGGQLDVGRGFFVTMQGSGTFYFLPLDGARDLNFPFLVELGFGSRF